MDNGSNEETLADVDALLLFETKFAKEAKDQLDCRGKLLECSILVETDRGLQCGLSGNLVPKSATTWSDAVKGNRPNGNILVHCWENLLDLKPQCLLDLLPPVLLLHSAEKGETLGRRAFPFSIMPQNKYFGGGKALG